MEIFAVKGHKVVVTDKSRKNGYEYDTEKVDEHLEVGKEYTVDYTDVGNWSTKVYLVEVPGVSFNSVNFRSVKRQSEDASKSHPDWERYN